MKICLKSRPYKTFLLNQETDNESTYLIDKIVMGHGFERC